MNVLTNSVAYVSIVIVWSMVMLPDAVQSDCGPLKMRASEQETCYDFFSRAEKPCPGDTSVRLTRALKLCRPPYALDSKERQITNVSYYCNGEKWAPVSFDSCRPDCGPLKVRLSEYGPCYDSESGAEIPCPDKSPMDTGIRKRCRPPYAIGSNENEIVNVTYYCAEHWWPRYDACRIDCGRPTANNKYPWLAAIYNGNGELKCTGTIISPVHVLAAVWCFSVNRVGKYKVEEIASTLTIVAGKHYSNINRKKESAQVRKVTKATGSHARIYDDVVLFEVDNEFDFSKDVQPICIDWSNYFEPRDFVDGNEAVAIDWDYNKDEVVPCDEPNEFNVQYWHKSTCMENLNDELWKLHDYTFCGTRQNLNRSNCGKSLGSGLVFKSSPWRYYLRGVTARIKTTPDVTYMFYATVSSYLNWLHDQIRSHWMYTDVHPFVTRDKDFSKRKTGCILPEQIHYGRFKLSFGDEYRVGAWVPTDTRILVICTVNSIGTSSSTRCNLGEWQPAIDMLKCKRPGTCPSIPSSESEDMFCRFNGQEISCVEPVNNSTAIVRCKPFHAIPGNKPIYKCEDGVWDQPVARCTLECGTKRVGVTTLIVGGSEVIKNEYPWVVAVYRSTQQVCGGTIISRSYVLSAAHCFTTPNGMAREKELFTIFAGKHYRDISVEEPLAQMRKIKFLHIHSDYKGNLQKYRDDIALIELDAELIPTLEVQPACLDWDNLYEDYDFIDGNKAVVAGWGYTNQNGPPSDALKKLVLSYRSKDVCMANLPEDFNHQYVATDKICAGDKDNNMTVCEGDSGGGLYFKSDDKHFYIRGIVSLTTRTQTGTCHLNKFALYTKVSKYLPWIETITRRVL